MTEKSKKCSCLPNLNASGGLSDEQVCRCKPKSMNPDSSDSGKTTTESRTIPGEITPERAKLLGLATKHLFDNLAHANEKFFRKLTVDAITDPEYGQIQITAAANFLRYLIHTNVSASDTDFVITQIMEGMRIAPLIEDEPEKEESKIIIPGVH